MRFFPSGKPSFPMLARIGCALIVAAAAGSGQAQYVGKQLGGGFESPAGVAVDGNGNVYVADTGHNSVKEVPLNCASSTCVTVLGGGFSGPIGVAVGADGKVYVSDTENNEVKEIPLGCVSSTCVVILGGGFSRPYGVAVDGTGDVFVADFGNNAIKEIPVGCSSSSCVTTLSPGYSSESVAVDGSGNAYFTESFNTGGAVFEIPSGCDSSGCVTGVGGFDGPTGVAVDGNGSVFVSEKSTSTVKAMPPGCRYQRCVTRVGGLFLSPWGIAVDKSDNIYFAESFGGVIEMAGAGLIFGRIGQPVDATTQFALGVGPGDDVQVSGWAAYPLQGGPVSKVTVLIDGTVAGDATLGIPKAPLVISYNNPSYYNAGWTITAPTSGLEAGQHAVSAIAYTSLDVPVYLANETFNLLATQTQAPPIGGVDEAVDASTQYTTVAQTDNLYVRGWATAVPGGFPIDKVVICVGGLCGNATTGFPRPGIAAKYNNPAYLNSGWEFSMPAASLSPGKYFVDALAYYDVTTWADLGLQVIQVSATPVQAPPFGSLGEAVDATTQTTTVSQSDTLYVQGWAVDPQQGAPVSNVSILIDGTVVGNATVGVARPYIAAQYHNAAYLHSGWTFTVSASGLSVGTHEVTAVATDALGLTKQLGTAFITVTE